MRQIAIFGLAVLPALAYGLLDLWGHEKLPAWSAATAELPLRDRVGIATWNAGIRYAPWFVLGGALLCPILSAALGWHRGRRPDTSGATDGVPAWGALAVASSLGSAFLLQQPGIGFVATLMILEWISIVAACLCFACAYAVLSRLKALPMPAWMAFGLIAVSYWVGGLMVAVSLSVAVWTVWVMTQRRRARLDGAVIDGRRPLGG